MRYLIVGYTAQGFGKEWTGNNGFIIYEGAPIPSWEEMKKSSLDWVKENIGEGFETFKINFMQFLDKADFNSFMQVEEGE